MPYVVLDLEWNQAMSSKSSVFNKLPIHLRGEIIQIGAVKLTDDFQPGEEFQRDIRPVYFRQIHYKVKKLTGFDKQRLLNGIKFQDAMDEFWQWCGPDCTFLTWGYDDKGIMEQNLIIHDMDIDWMGKWINLQIIYNLQTGGDRNQKALSTAMEHFGIEQTRTAHDALGDAYNTALVCSRLDLPAGLAQYDDSVRFLSTKPRKVQSEEDASSPIPLEHTVSRPYNSKAEAFSDPELTEIPCPVCGAPLKNSRWVNQGDRRYMTLSTCSEHNKFLVRLKFRRNEDESWSVNRIIYQADDSIEKYYRGKATKRRSGKHRSRRSSKTSSRVHQTDSE